MGLHLLIVLVCLRVVTFIYPVPIYTKDILNHTCFHPWQPSHLKHEPTNLQRMSTHIHKTMRGSLFPLLPLRVKCQNHERVPISPISPILVVHALSSCQDMGHQNRGNRDTFMVLALHQGKTLRGSLFPLFPLRVKLPKPWDGPYSPYFPYFGGPCLVMGHQNRGNEAFSWFWHFIKGKHWRGSLFPLFPLRVKCQNHERVPISPISPILVVHVLARWKDRPWK